MTATVIDAPRSARLAKVTDGLHEHLHTLVAAADPFESHGRFRLWLQVQYRFQYEIEPLYRHPALQALVPDLNERSRLEAVKADLSDLNAQPPVLAHPADFDPEPCEALGWLFVSEGSRLGAALQLKRASALGLSGTYGARHMAPAAVGRNRHWKRFTEALDQLELTEDEEDRLDNAACSAFRRFDELLRDGFDLPA